LLHFQRHIYYAVTGTTVTFNWSVAIVKTHPLTANCSSQLLSTQCQCSLCLPANSMPGHKQYKKIYTMMSKAEPAADHPTPSTGNALVMYLLSGCWNTQIPFYSWQINCSCWSMLAVFLIVLYYWSNIFNCIILLHCLCHRLACTAYISVNRASKTKRLVSFARQIVPETKWSVVNIVFFFVY
jgi:hypothetical protein